MIRSPLSTVTTAWTQKTHTQTHSLYYRIIVALALALVSASRRKVQSKRTIAFTHNAHSQISARAARHVTRLGLPRAHARARNAKNTKRRSRTRRALCQTDARSNEHETQLKITNKSSDHAALRLGGFVVARRMNRIGIQKKCWCMERGADKGRLRELELRAERSDLK